MHHDTPLISTIVAGLVLAFIFGMIANRFKMPPLVGYLFAGILVGPHTPGFVADQALGAELAELGVILLMFGVGLHFSLKDLMSVRALAIPGAVAQMGFATLLGAGLGLLMGWELGGSLLFGLALSVASTVVLLKALQDRRLIESEKGRIAVGWLIVEDLAMVLALVLIPAVASLGGADTGVHDPFVSFVERILGMEVGIWGVLALTIIKVAAFVGFMLIVGRRVIPWALHGTAHTGSRELFRLAVLAIALGVALGSAVLFGVSLALGAFFAGMILSESELSHRAAQETLPLRDAFAVLFFVSVGMLFDPSILIEHPLTVIATVFIIVIGKSLAAFAIVLLFRRPISTALTISASLAQIGEFSFILASMGVSLALLPKEGQDLILAGALISIVLNPVVFWAVDAVKPRLEGRAAARRGAPTEAARVEPGEATVAATGPAVTDTPSHPAVDRDDDEDTGEASTKTGHTVLVGYGQVGRIVASGIKADGGEIVVIEDSDHDVAAARAAGLEVVFGNAASADTLRLANLGAARNLLIAISNGFEAGSVCEVGRKLNPPISIIARAYSEEEESFLRNLGATTVIRGEREIGKGILAFLRGDKSEVTTSAVPATVEPKLPQAENILDAAAAPIVAAAGVVVTAPEPVAAAEPTALDAEAVAGADTEARISTEPVDVAFEEAPVIEAVATVVEPAVEEQTEAIDAEPVLLDVVEATPHADGVIAVAPSEPAEADSAAATLETVKTTPAVGEAPAQIDEVVPVAEVTGEAEAETPAEAAVDLAQQESDAVSEGGIAPPAEEEKPAEPVVPPVIPEPKS